MAFADPYNDPRIVRVFAAMIHLGWTRYRFGSWVPGVLSKDGKRWKRAWTPEAETAAINAFLRRHPESAREP